MVNNKTVLVEFVEEFQAFLKQNIHLRSYDIARTVVLLLRKLVGKVSWTTAKQLIGFVKSLGDDLFEVKHSEVIINMAKRVTKLIREEYFEAIGTVSYTHLTLPTKA